MSTFITNTLNTKTCKMKYSSLLIILIPLFALSILSCNKDDDQNQTQSHDCTFEQIDENMDGLIDDNESTIMTQCQENEILSKSELESKIIGEWELIGHGEGWVPSVSQPCGYITITSDELVFEFTNASIDTVTTHSWEINQIFTPSIITFLSLDVTPDGVEGLFINRFCDEFMFGDGTPSDGNMYLYQKVN